MARIGFLGLGRMGQRMAARLLDAGHEVVVWNRSPGKAEALLAAGGMIARTPAAAAREADAVFSMVINDSAAAAVWLASDGALAAMRPGALAIECSTLSHPFVLQLAAAAKERGLRYLDCPVTGFPSFAEAGKLTLLVGAAPADLDAARPLLAPLSQTILHFGDVGTGTAYKLINNLMAAVHMAGLAEAVTAAERLGLDREILRAAIATGFCASPIVKKYVDQMIDAAPSDRPDFTIGGRHKDAKYALAMQQAAGVNATVGAATTELFRRAAETAFDLDEGSVIRAVRHPK